MVDKKQKKTPVHKSLPSKTIGDLKQLQKKNMRYPNRYQTLYIYSTDLRARVYKETDIDKLFQKAALISSTRIPGVLPRQIALSVSSITSWLTSMVTNMR